MSRRTGQRLGTGSRVVVDATHWPELLEDMTIVDGDDNYVEGVSMNGSIETVTDRHFVVCLDAARKSLRFPRNKVRRLVAADAVADHSLVTKNFRLVHLIELQGREVNLLVDEFTSRLT